MFTILSFVILMISASLAINNIDVVGDETETIASDAMIEQVHRNMQLSAAEAAGVIERKAFTAFSTVQALADAAGQILTDEKDIFGEKQSYSDLNINSVPNAEDDPEYGFQVSKTTSTYYIPSSTILTSEINSIINRSANLDVIFESLLSDNPEFVWFNLIITEGKIERRFPGSLVSSNRNFDPTIEPWYLQAVFQRAPIFTPPVYISALGRWTITIAIPIIDSSDNIIAVMSGDLSLTAIREKVGEISFLKSGFAALILRYPDPNYNGMIVAHPDWNPSTGGITKLTQVETNSDGSDALTQAQELTLITANPYIEEFAKNDENYLIANTKPIFEVFVLLIIVAEDEALDGVAQIHEDINSTQNQITSLTIFVSILTITGVLVIGLFISNNITRPISQLSTSAQNIVSKVTERDYIDTMSYDATNADQGEIGNLQRSFSSMIEALKRDSKKNK